ncbi:thermostable hemolysin [Ectopseudomonas oleovorans]|uniref:thermostable hemolysin n=1 Tax=Ectopseudomonas oleovorans TaxID=301 RepID=UPI000CF01D75|nr:thermostable hemolysin [Pseudomonas oleovorans]PPV39261.1 thermostable hemolysin [Pseudomonas oleovorans]
MELPWAQHDRPVARIGRGDSYELHLASPGSARRVALEQFVCQRFELQHGARIRHFMPCLFGLENQIGQVLGAVGVRSGNSGPLFLERYLNEPIQTAIGSRLGNTEPGRGELVEVGNLAADSPGAARLLIVALTDLLVALGFRWVTFTGTPTLLNSFQRLGLTPIALGEADPARMGDELVDWGSYYDNRPLVMAGDIHGGHQRLLQLGAYPRLGHQPLYALEEMPDVVCS